jgi:DNA repair protein RecN (Recombination protein N)
MLAELVIENYAVIDRLRVLFHPGLNLLTGETGSGKSIIVDALALLFGGRASADAIRSGADRARVTGIFNVPAGLLLESVEAEDGELLIEREILAEGKSRAFINSRLVTAALLKDLATHLGDIHGQHEQQMLFAPDTQRRMVDQFAGASPNTVATLYEQWRTVSREIEKLERTEQEKLRLLDLWTFQRREIESASLSAGEDVALEDERRVLLHLTRLQESAGAAFDALYDAPQSALAQLRGAAKKIEDIARIDPALNTIREALEPAEISLREASYALRDYLSKLETSPGRIDEVEERLAAIDKLKRKYGASVEEIVAFLENVRAQIEAVEHSGERLAELRKEQLDVAREYEVQAAKLTAVRKKGARALEKRVVEELSSLAMAGTTFRVEISSAEWSESGVDALHFLVSANLGEEPRPLEKVASGGELSRIALALKTCLATKGAGRTLVFDEVDAGVGGRAAQGIGRRLKLLAAGDQVLCVTHLAQVAAFADHHYVVEKRETRGRTAAVIEELDADARVREIGRMLSGEKVTPEALRHAEQLIVTSVEARR